MEPEKPAAQPNEWSERLTVHAPVLPAEKARQGATGQKVRYVLSFGMLAIIVAFIAVYIVYFA